MNFKCTVLAAILGTILFASDVKAESDYPVALYGYSGMQSFISGKDTNDKRQDITSFLTIARRFSTCYSLTNPSIQQSVISCARAANLLNAGHRNECLAETRRLISGASVPGPVLLCAANLFLNCNQLDECKSALDRFTLRSNHLEYLLDLARLRIAIGEYEQAFSVLERYAQQRHERVFQPYYYYLKASVAEQLGKKDQAYSLFKKSGEICMALADDTGATHCRERIRLLGYDDTLDPPSQSKAEFETLLRNLLQKHPNKQRLLSLLRTRKIVTRKWISFESRGWQPASFTKPWRATEENGIKLILNRPECCFQKDEISKLFSAFEPITRQRLILGTCSSERISENDLCFELSERNIAICRFDVGGFNSLNSLEVVDEDDVPGCVTYYNWPDPVDQQIKKGEFEVARAIAKERLNHTHCAIALSSCAKVEQAAGNFAEAAKIWTKVLEKEPWSQYMLQRAQCYFENGEYQRAFDDANACRDLKAPSHHSFLLAAKAAKYLGYTDLAKENSKKAIQIYYDSAEIGKRDEAQKLLDELVRMPTVAATQKSTSCEGSCDILITKRNPAARQNKH